MSMLEMEVRPLIEQEIERLLEILDTLDLDPDLEDTADHEPWLGMPERLPGSWSGLYLEGNDDRVEDDCDSEDGGDDEPSLGSSNSFAGSWESRRVSRVEDREDECEDEGAQCDDEGAIDTDREREEEGTGIYICHCSAISSLIGGSHDK